MKSGNQNEIKEIYLKPGNQKEGEKIDIKSDIKMKSARNQKSV